MKHRSPGSTEHMFTFLGTSKNQKLQNGDFPENRLPPPRIMIMLTVRNDLILQE